MPAPTPARRGLCLVLAAPSGTGKSSIVRALLAEDPAVTVSVSVTTRTPRPGEVEGQHYYFRPVETFERMAAEGALLEWATVFGRGYGSPRAPVEAALAEGRDVLFDIDWQGFRQLRRALPDDVVGVFLLPPSLAELEARLRARGGDDQGEIARRMAAAQGEIAHAGEFDHVVVNREFATALGEVRAILRAARLRARAAAGPAA